MHPQTCGRIPFSTGACRRVQAYLSTTLITTVCSLRVWDGKSCNAKKERLLCQFKGGIRQYAIEGGFEMLYIERMAEEIELQTSGAPKLQSIIVKTGNVRNTCDRMKVDRANVKLRGMDPREDAGGLSREYVLRIPSVS